MRNSFSRRNLTYHLLAALLALVLWSYVKTAALVTPSDVSKSFSDVALETRNLAPDLQITNTVPQTVTVTVRGTSALVDQVTRESLAAYIDLEAASEGSGQYAVRISAPQGVSVSASPSRLEVWLEQVLTVDWGVQAAGDLVIADDQLLVANLNPQFVRISGIRSQIERLSKAVVQTNWTGAASGTPLSLPVQALDSTGQEVKGLRIQPAVIQAEVIRYPGKTVNVVVTTAGQLPAGLQLTTVQPTPSAVTLYGPADVLAAVQTVGPAPINLDSLTANATVSLPLQLPTGVLAASSSQVQVTVQVKP